MVMASCGEQFLEVKSDASIGTPVTIENYQALLDVSTSLMNQGSTRTLGMIGGDELELSYTVWQGVYNLWERNAYIWADDVYQGESINDWNMAYRRILQANLALEGSDKIDPGPDQSEAWNNLRGSALFFRALNFHELAQEFCAPYDRSTASGDMGIPLRLESDVTLKSKRSTVAQTYGQIVADLQEAAKLLPTVPRIKMRPSAAAAIGLLARVYLAMEDYGQSHHYADELLKINSALTDLNETVPVGTYTFVRDYGESNPEIVFFNYFNTPLSLAQARMNVDSELLALYDENDLRKSLFYNYRPDGKVSFKGSLTGFSNYFTGISTAEMLLVRAESAVRLGRISEASEDLNTLRSRRILSAAFEEIEESDPDILLKEILEERRRELAFRGLRWEDLRRLNRDARFAKEIRRELDGAVYVLKPNDKKYIWPIPKEVIDLSGMEQNPR